MPCAYALFFVEKELLRESDLVGGEERGRMAYSRYFHTGNGLSARHHFLDGFARQQIGVLTANHQHRMLDRGQRMPQHGFAERSGFRGRGLEWNRDLRVVSINPAPPHAHAAAAC